MATAGARLLLFVDKLMAEPSSETAEVKGVLTSHLHHPSILCYCLKTDWAFHFRIVYNRQETFKFFPCRVTGPSKYCQPKIFFRLDIANALYCGPGNK